MIFPSSHPSDGAIQDLAVLPAEILEVRLHLVERLDHVSHLCIHLGDLETVRMAAPPHLGAVSTRREVPFSGRNQARLYSKTLKSHGTKLFLFYVPDCIAVNGSEGEQDAECTFRRV